MAENTDSGMKGIEGRRAVIIGAGIGGITTALLLAKNGYSVDIYEKNEAPGGRCGQLIRNGYRFDLGATMLMMPGIYRRVFGVAGIPLFEDDDIRIEKDLYNICFDDNTVLTFTTDQERLKRNLEEIEQGSFPQSQKYVKAGYTFFRIGIDKLIARNFDHLLQFANVRNLGLLIKLKTYISHFAYVKKFFRHPHLRMAFSFQNIYVGQSPFGAPALFSMIPAAELTEGSYFPKGGMYAVVQKLVQSARESGVRFHFNAPVKKIRTSGRKAGSIVLEDGGEIEADVVVANADLPYVYRRLLPGRRKSARIDRMKYASSAICFHWGVDKVYPQLGHHTVFLTDDYKAGMKTIFRKKSLPDNPCFYVHAPVRSDPAAAPSGHDALSVVIGAGHLDASKRQDWEQLKMKARAAVIGRLRQEGLTDLEEHIRYEACLRPGDWEKECNISRGSVFGSLAHNLLQMGYFRPHNQHKRYRNLYFTGGSTQPGNGIPNVLLSALLTSERILNKKL